MDPGHKARDDNDMGYITLSNSVRADRLAQNLRRIGSVVPGPGDELVGADLLCDRPGDLERLIGSS